MSSVGQIMGNIIGWRKFFKNLKFDSFFSCFLIIGLLKDHIFLLIRLQDRIWSVFHEDMLKFLQKFLFLKIFKIYGFLENSQKKNEKNKNVEIFWNLVRYRWIISVTVIVSQNVQ